MIESPDPTEVVDVLLAIMGHERESAIVIVDGLSGISEQDIARELRRRRSTRCARSRTR
jgi:hypothetical protein